MEHIFLEILNTSLKSVPLISAILIARALLKKAPKRLTVWLWGTVALRLLIPFSVESIFSLFPVDKTFTIGLSAPTPYVSTGIDSADYYVNDALTSYVDPGTGIGQILFSIGTVLWVVGIISTVQYGIISYIKIRKLVSESVPTEENIRICDKIEAPFVFGIIKPRIYLPSSLNGDNARYIIAHEKAHLKRHDNIWKLCAFILTAIHWFNPMIWISYILFCRDIESACDEEVISQLGAEAKKPYANALVSCSCSKRSLHVTTLSFGKNAVRSRVKNILNFKKPSAWIITVTLLSAVILSLCFLTDPLPSYTPEQAYREFERLSNSDSIHGYATLFKGIANGDRDKAREYAEIFRKNINTSAAFEDSEIFDIAESYAEAIEMIERGKAEHGVSNIQKRNGAIQIDYFYEPSGYSVANIPKDDPKKPADIGENVIRISLSDTHNIKKIIKKYPLDSVCELSGAKNTKILLTMTDVHSLDIYIGSDETLTVEERPHSALVYPCGTITIKLTN